MSQDKRKPGRPPSPQARARALKAAQEILLRDGFGRLTIEAVATASGTGKPTIYRHWANATELAMEALIADTDPVALPDTRTAPRAALMRRFASLKPDRLDGPRQVPQERDERLRLADDLSPLYDLPMLVEHAD